MQAIALIARGPWGSGEGSQAAAPAGVSQPGTAMLRSGWTENLAGRRPQ